MVADSDRHWLHAARAAGVKGTYFFRTSPEDKAVSAAVHVAEVASLEEAKALHRKLWNQGVSPFLIVILPAEIRVFTGFSYDPAHPKVGEVIDAIPAGDTIETIVNALSAFTSEAINRGEIWEANTKHLGAENRVDTTLLRNLLDLSNLLCEQYSLSRDASHSLIGKFVYFSYLRAREILSDKWLVAEVGLRGDQIFQEEVFSSSIAHSHFRKLSDAVEARFNGKLFPIRWGTEGAPKAEAVQKVARVFAGEEALSRQGHLSFKAYDFASVPVEFLSSIYEQFLHVADGDNLASDPEKQGAHYTPESLADYLVTEVNSISTLKQGMKVLDPCCGSGVFLVVAYRRLVEIECRKQGKHALNASELKEILVSSIYGVERNLTACQITGFSLILALLSYVDPPELHRRRNFKFPDLIGTNLFNQDFFDEEKPFWKELVAEEGAAVKFDWILGNPPWVELDLNDPKAKPLLEWSKNHQNEYNFARGRTGEPFACKVLDCLAPDGTVGMLLHAKTLTNDQLEKWRRKFFGEVAIRRVTNFSNFSSILFPSGKHPTMSLIYQSVDKRLPNDQILHLGPFVANQHTISPKRSGKRRSWIVGFTESEVKVIPASNFSDGSAMAWKMALWANYRDAIAIKKIKRVFSNTLGNIASEKSWKITLGLQLRSDEGTERDPNEEIFDEKGKNILSGLKVLDHKKFIRRGGALSIPGDLLVTNGKGIFVRKRGGKSGLDLISEPRVFLWQTFAAYIDESFIIQHDKIGLVGGSPAQMKAVAAVWNTSFVGYLLFFVTSAAWGIGYNQIDKGDVVNLPFPQWSDELESQLSYTWEEASTLEKKGSSLSEIRQFLDLKVSELLEIPEWVTLLVQDFFNFRYQLTNGKVPAFMRTGPSEEMLLQYAYSLRDELDQFLSGKAYHKVNISSSPKGSSVSVTIVEGKKAVEPDVKKSNRPEAHDLNSLLKAAESKISQWFYVKRSVRLFDGDTIHLIKPSQQMEWTRTRALLDADDLIAEAIEERRRTAR